MNNLNNDLIKLMNNPNLKLSDLSRLGVGKQELLEAINKATTVVERSMNISYKTPSPFMNKMFAFTHITDHLQSSISITSIQILITEYAADLDHLVKCEMKYSQHKLTYRSLISLFEKPSFEKGNYFNNLYLK